MTIRSFIEAEKFQSFEFLKYDIENSVVSLELLTDLVGKVREITNMVHSTLDKVYNKGDYIPFISINNRKLKKKLDIYNYVDLSSVSVYKPIGLNTRFNVLSEAVGSIQTDLLTIVDRLLTPFFKWTGEILNRPEKLRRITVNQEMTFLDGLAYNKKLDTIFNPDDISDTATFGELFENNYNLIENIRIFNHCIKAQNDLSAKKLMQKVDEAAKRSEILVRRCKVNQDDLLCSNASRKVIADVFYDIGVELTLYSRISYIIFSTRSALEDTAQKIIKMG